MIVSFGCACTGLNTHLRSLRKRKKHWTANVLFHYFNPHFLLSVSCLDCVTYSKVCVCPYPTGTAMTEVAGSGKPANQRCAAPYFLSQMASIPLQFNQRCQRNCTNPEVDTLIALYLHRLLATYIKLNLSLLMSFFNATENGETVSQMEKM